MEWHLPACTRLCLTSLAEYSVCEVYLCCSLFVLVPLSSYTAAALFAGPPAVRHAPHEAFMGDAAIVNSPMAPTFSKLDYEQDFFICFFFFLCRTLLENGKLFSVSLLLSTYLVPFSSRYSPKVKCKPGLSVITMGTETKGTHTQSRLY